MLSSLTRNAAYRIVKSLLWFLVLVGLPLTSFPILNQLTGAIVAPFSAIPLGILILIWLVPYLLEKGQIPIEVLPFLYFILIALIVSALAFFLDGYYAKGRDYFDQSFRAFITVAIGLSFYLVFSTYPQNEKALQQTFSFIYIGGALLILWTIFEVVMLRTFDRVQDLPGWMISLRNRLAVQSPTVFFTNRVTGFAYEPSWFVRQFNLVLFPIWMSAVFQRKSAVKFRLWKIQLEDLLMLGGLIVFGASSPRIGLLAFLASLAFLGILFLQRLHRGFTAWYIKRRKVPPLRTIYIKIVLALMMLLLMIVLVASALMGYILVASQWDRRYELLLRDSTLENLNIFPITETSLIYAARQLAFYERVIFWFGGWNIFNDYPFGVGLGNAGFYFIERMHGAGYDSFEIRNLVYRANYLPNIKSLWIRLLAETGFIGLAVFLVWLYMLWRSAGLTRKSDSNLLQILGLAGQLFLLAYIVEGFSMDSFAMPYQWLMGGLISAGGILARRKLKIRDKPLESLSAQA